MTLTVDIGHRFGTFALEASLTADGGVTALFGRSGSGKTSLVRIIAGLVQPDRGRVIFDGRILTDTQAGLSVPVHRRRFGYVFQEARLFPHLTVQGNLTYGRWFTPMSERQADFRRIIDMLGIGALLARMPSGLSGGEKQRVAIGRALLSSPRLLLMDEPLSALDEARRADILPYLERLRDETRIPIIYVSHSVGEVARLANRVVLLRDSAIQAMGSPSDIFSRQSVPEDRRQAGALLDGQVCAIDAAHRLATIALKGGAALTVPAGGFVLGRSVRLHVPARDVMIATLRPDGLSALNILDGKVLTIGHSSDGAAEIRIDCNGHILLSRITSFSAARLDLTPDKPVFAIVKTVAIEP